MMASNMPWTEELGAAFLGQQPEVMDAVQRMRQRAQSYGYLRSNSRVIVRTGPYIEIAPVNPAFIVVPYYDPLIVYAPPRRGFVVSRRHRLRVRRRHRPGVRAVGLGRRRGSAGTSTW